MGIVAGYESVPAAEQAQLGIRVKAAVAHPAAEEQILARESIAAHGAWAGDRGANFFSQSGTDLFVGVEQQHPLFRAKIDGVLLLSDVTAPRFDDDSRSLRTRDLARAIFRAGVDEHDFIRPADAGQSAADVRFFIHRHDGHGNCHKKLLIVDC